MFLFLLCSGKVLISSTQEPCTFKGGLEINPAHLLLIGMNLTLKIEIKHGSFYWDSVKWQKKCHTIKEPMRDKYQFYYWSITVYTGLSLVNFIVWRHVVPLYIVLILFDKIWVWHFTDILFFIIYLEIYFGEHSTLFSLMQFSWMLSWTS